MKFKCQKLDRINKVIILACAVLNILSVKLNAQELPAHIGKSQLYYGAAYYPEAWDLKGIDADIVRMKELNMNVMRMAEFSWGLMEPEEGKYDFKWLHTIVEKLNANGIDVILGTPTATPPAWMASKYPEIFLTKEDGTILEHGARRSCSYTNPKYMELSQKICEVMAREFGQKQGVIGWQTDNEFGMSPDYSEYTNQLWHQWLKEKYGEIENLNDIWVTNLWSQKYDEFDQIPMPKSHIWHHPSLRLDWNSFSMAQLIKFQQIHIDAIRKYSKLPITHDGMPGQMLDYPKLFEDLDYMATNVYHSFPVYNKVQSNFDRMRGYKKGMHWLFETAPNNSGGGQKGQTWFVHQPEGALRAAIWMNHAMGAQGSMFWLWRQQPAGQEMPHGAILSAWGKPAVNFDALKVLGSELNAHSELLMNTPVKNAEIAIIYSHLNDQGLRIEQQSNGIKYYDDWTYRFYRPLSDAFLHRDVIHENIDLERYKLVFAPLMPVISDQLNARLKTWVEDGGTLILGPMSAYRSEHWTAFTNHALGEMGEWIGIDVESRIPIDPFNEKHDAMAEIKFQNQNETVNYKAALWSEALSSEKGTDLATYENGMHDGKAAIIENKVGKGKVVFLGTDPGEKAIKQLVLKYAKDQKIQPLAQGDKNILVVPRKGKTGEYKFIINLQNEEQKLVLYKSIEDQITGEKMKAGTISLKPYEVILGKETKN